MFYGVSILFATLSSREIKRERERRKAEKHRVEK